MRNGWKEKPLLGIDPITSVLRTSASSTWTKGHLFVVFSPLEQQPDGLWKHASISHPRRYPFWDEILDVRYSFFGDEDEVFQILPPKREYLNIHKNCFHLWSPVGRRITPG